MKMIPGYGTISNYGSYIHNCQSNQMPYKIPVNSLSDVQLYIAIGGVEPVAIQYELIHTCGAMGGQTGVLTSSSYVIGQDTTGNWYGVFKGLSGAEDLTCFVIAITLTFSEGSGSYDSIYFSEEYCIEETCNVLTLLKGCYGNLDNKLSYDCNGIYFGVPEGNSGIGDSTLVYKHELLLRHVEVTLSAIKNSFKQGRTRNFRTEKEKLFLFWGELIPEWYVSEVDAIFYRGEVFVDGVKYIVNETSFEKVEECKKMWKPTASFKESCYQSFSCEADPCSPPIPEPCCEPQGISATVTIEVCCEPENINASVEIVNLD